MTQAEVSSIGSFRGAGPDDGMEDVSLLFEEPLAGMVRTLHVGDHAPAPPTSEDEKDNKPLPLLHAAANRDLITDLLAPADLNVGAFGRAYADCEEFGEHLRRFASLNPDVFYDQALMPLLQRSYAIADRFFGCGGGGGGASSSTAQVAFVPNCSHGMKAVLDTLVLDGKHTEIAYLDPLYPATAALLQYLEKMSPGEVGEVGGGRKVVRARAIPLRLSSDHDEEGDRDNGEQVQGPAAVGDSGINHSLFAEEADVFVNSLAAAWRENAFTVLVADEVASQTGRVLPLEEVACWCEEKGVLLVVDGTQSADYFQEKFFGGGDEVVPAPGGQGGGTFVPKPRLHPVDAVGRGLKRKLRLVDYYVLSTHKWLGNVKTAGVVRWRTSTVQNKVVLPPTRVSAVSFGFDKYPLASLRESFFLWTGMGAQYVPYITLGKALLLFAEFGQRQLQHATDLLQKGLALIPEGKWSSRSRQLRVPMAVIRVHNVRERFFPEYADDKPITATAFQNKLQKDFGVFVSVKPVDDKISVCGGTSSSGSGEGKLCEFKKRGSGNANGKSKFTPSESFYLRLSVWSGNSIAEFEKLRDVLTCNVNLKTMLQLLAIAYCPYPTTEAMQKAVKEDLLHSSSPEKVGFEVSAEDALAPAAEKNDGAEAAKATDASTSTRKPSKPSKPHDPTQHSRTAAAAFYATYLRAPTEGERTKALAQFKAVLKHQFLFTFGLYERLFSTLKTEALFFRAERLRHHLIFYLGHTAVFYWNKLVSAGWVAASDRINPKFEAIFAVGVDEMSWDDLLEENYDWCGFSEEKQEEYRGAVEEYRGLVKESVCALIDGYALEDADRVSSSREGEGASGTTGCPENAGLMRAACGKLLSQQIVDKYNAVAGGGGATKSKNFSTSINTSSTSDCLAKTLQDTMLWIFLMGTEHEKIHQETSCCIISQMPLRMLRGTDDEKMRWLYGLNQLDHHQPKNKPSSNRLVPVAGGAVAFGKTNDAVERNYYGWDNEFDGEVAHLSPFEVSQKLVSNAEYLEFMNENGYGERKYWTDEGWRFVRDLNVSRPRWWLNADNENEIQLGRPLDSSVTKPELDTWLEENNIKSPTTPTNFKYRAMLSVIPMPWDWPVEVNNLEAAAFCKWKAENMNKPNLRLLGHPEQLWLAQNAKKHNSNLNLTQGASPTPVDDERNAGYVEDNYMDKRTGKPEKTIQKLYDVTGNVWRHSCSVLTLMPGFKPHRAYDDFTLPTIDGEHNFILGGSWTSLGNCANVGSRYGFRRHFYQYAGIRYVHCAVEVGGPRSEDGGKLEYTDQNLASGAIHTTAPRIHAATPLGVKLSEHYYELYETPNAHLGMDEDVARYLGTEDKVLSNWPRFLGEVGVAVVGKMQEALKLTPGTRNKLEILVVHGSVGRSSLELLKGCENVSITHTDNTANLLQPFEEVLLQGRVQWRQTVEGEICDTREYYLDKSQSSLDNKAKNNSISLVQIPDYQTSLNKLPENKKFDLIIADFRYLSCEAEIAKLAERLEAGNGVMLLATLQEMSSVYNLFPANGGGSAGEKNNGCMKMVPDDGFLESAVRAEKLGFYRSIGDTEPERVKSVWRGGRERGFAHLEKQTKHKHQFWRSYLSCWKAAASALDSTATGPPQPLPAQPDESESLSRGASGALVNHNQKTTQYYQDDDILSSYYQFHYGDLLAPKTSSLQQNVGNFPAATAAFCLEMCEKYLLPPTIKASTTAKSEKTLALDAGCGPGRSAFELLKGGFETVEAFDYATGFVDMLEKEKRLDPFSLFGDESTSCKKKQELICYQADAHKLLEVCRFPESTYDLVSGANLIDRLHSPEVFLEGCKKLVRVGGLIVHMSPYTWKPEHTEREKWVGGKFTPEMEKLFTEEALKEMHRERFEFVESRKIPFVIPDTDGSFQFTFSNAVAFRRTE